MATRTKRKTTPSRGGSRVGARAKAHHASPYMLMAFALAGAVVAAAALYLGHTNLEPYVSPAFRWSVRHLAVLQHIVERHYVLSVALYFAAYVGLVSVSVPGAMWLSILAGFLFGLVEGLIYAPIAATIGAVCAMFVARHIFTHWVEKHAGKHLHAIQDGFCKDPFNYMLVLRLMPGCPFVVVNLAAAALDMRLVTYALATFIGIFPGQITQVLIGVGLREVVAKGGHISMADLAMDPTMMFGLVGLALIAAAPIVYHHFSKKKR